MSVFADRPCRAILFDLDDTLYDRRAAFLRWAESYLRETCGLSDDILCQEALTRIAALDAGGYGSKKAVLEEVCRIYSPALASERAEERTSAFYLKSAEMPLALATGIEGSVPFRRHDMISFEFVGISRVIA